VDQFPSARTHRWLDWLVTLSLAAASAAVVIWQNTRLAVLWDLSYILENSYRISLGQVPYRDFPFPYAPITFLTQAAIIKLTGRVFFHHVIYCAALGAFSTLLTWRILLHVLRSVPGVRLLALLLTLPLTVLSVYAVFPHPFYDSDCTFAILACLLLLLHWRHKSSSVLIGFITGAALVVPIFIKQNVGLVFTASVTASLVLLFVIDVHRFRRVRHYVSLFAGLVVSFAAAVFLLHRTAGLRNYIQWTVRFAAQRRTPALAEMIGMYREISLKWWLMFVVLGMVLCAFVKGTFGKGALEARFGKSTEQSKIPERLLLGLSLILLAVPFVWPVIHLFLDSDPSERAERLVNLWPLAVILSLASVVLTIIRRSRAAIKEDSKSDQGELGADLGPAYKTLGANTSEIDLLLPLIIIATGHGAFMSQQLWGSTYALWPLFLILVATIIAAGFEVTPTQTFPAAPTHTSDNRQSTIGNWQCVLLASLISLSLLISGFCYIRSHERLDYANLDDGDLTHSSLPALRGLATRGSWLPDFEELVAYTDKEIPRYDGILYLPGEDLFYYATGRVPRFPVLLFDHTVNPYSPQEIVDLARARNIEWLIVKDDLQLEEEPLERKDELMNLLEQDFESVDSLNNYEIYKRKAPESEDDEPE
jgi:hypothetical protein